MSNNSLFSTDRKVIDLNSKDMFSIESFAALQKFSANKIDEKNKIVHDWPLISLDDISRNGSLYESTGFLQALNSMYIQELIRRGTWFGELDHPPASCSRERFLTVDHNNINHRIMNYHLEGNRVVGDIQFVAPKGNISWDWVTKGVNLSLSTRVLTPNYKEEETPSGQHYVRKFGNMRLVTFDMISSAPGFKSCSIVSDVDTYDASKEDWSGIHLNWTAGRKKEEFVRLLKSQESIAIMEDVYGFTLSENSKISYSQEGLITIETVNKPGYSKSICIPSSVYKVNQVLMSGR